MPEHEVLTPPPEMGKRVREICFLAMVYALAARVEQFLAMPPDHITRTWLSSGIILAAVLFRGAWIWPGIFLGAMFGTTWAYFDSLSAVGVLRCVFAGAANGTGDVLAALASARLLMKAVRGRDPFGRAHDVIWFVILGASLGGAISAFGGVTGFCAAGFIPWASFPGAFAKWWAGAGVGMLILTPTLLAWRAGWRGGPRGRELLVFALLLGGACFGNWALLSDAPGLLVLPLLMWAVFRFDRRVSFTAILAVASFAVVLTVLGHGPFSEGDLNTRLVSLHAFLVLVSLPMLVLHGALAEKRDAREHLLALNRDLDQRVQERTRRLEAMLADLEKARRHLADAQTIAHLGSWEWDVVQDVVCGTAEFCRMFGVEAEQIACYDAFERLLHPDDRKRVRQEVGKSLQLGRPYETEYRAILPDGQVRYIYARGKAEFDEEGKPLCMAGTCLDVTHRRHMEEAVREREQELRLTMNSTPALISYIDANYRYRRVNESYERWFGHKAEDVCGIHVRDVLGEAAWEAVRTYMERALAGETVTYERALPYKDGGTRWVYVTYTPDRDLSKRVRGFVAHVVDISPLKQVEDALRVSELNTRQRAEELQTLMELAPLAIWVAHDPECRRITGNRAANAFYEADADENVSAGTAFGGEQDMTRRFFQNGRELAPEELPMQVAARKDEDIRGVELTVLRPSGQSFTMLGNASPLYDDQGRVRGCIGCFVDITPRKQAEEGVRLLNQRLKTLQEAIAQLASVKTLDEIKSVARTAARVLTGADGATFVLRDDDRCFYADEDAIAPLWKGQRFPMSSCVSGWVMLHQQSVAIEDIYADPRIPADVYRPTFVKSLAMVPIRTAEPLGAIGNYWAAKRCPSNEEMALLRSSADGVAVAMENVQSYQLLEQRVRERTAELEAANKELEAFSYSVSHDLRAPLRGIQGWSQALVEDYGDKLDEQARGYLTTVSGEAQRMGQLIDDLLELSRVSRTGMNREAVDLSALAHSILASLQLREPERNVRPIIADGLHALGDPVLLRQLLENLLGNAWKFTSKRPVAVIEFGSSASSNHPIIQPSNDSAPFPVFFVRDNGAGFSMAHASKLFAPFQRLHRPSEFPGTGIGLATVQRILHRHGGLAWAEGEQDKGATFYFTLPKATGNAKRNGNGRRSGANGNGRAAQRKSTTKNQERRTKNQERRSNHR